MMKKSAIIVGIVGAAVILVVVMLSVVSAAPSVPTQRVTFTKEVSDPTPKVGEIFAFTLNVANVSTETLILRVVDPNPAPAYLRYLTDTLPGTLFYSPTIQAVVWEGEVRPGSAVGPIVFQVEVTGIPTTALTTGYLVTNTATMVDIGVLGSLPTQYARRAFRIMPERLLLPLVVRNAGG